MHKKKIKTMRRRWRRFPHTYVQPKKKKKTKKKNQFVGEQTQMEPKSCVIVQNRWPEMWKEVRLIKKTTKKSFFLSLSRRFSLHRLGANGRDRTSPSPSLQVPTEVRAPRRERSDLPALLSPQQQTHQPDRADGGAWPCSHGPGLPVTEPSHSCLDNKHILWKPQAAPRL